MRKKAGYRIGYLTIAIIGLWACVRYYYVKDYKSMEAVQTHVNGDMITFSEDSGFYGESISVSLNKNVEVPASARIYYTLDGDDPTEDKKEYTAPIYLRKKDAVNVYPLKAVVCYDGEYSEIYEKTYVLCDDTENELDVDVVSVTSDRENLFDYETGIMVPGKTYDDSAEENGDKGGYIRGNYNNRGEEWIRDAHVAIFSPEGNLAVDQNIGLGISGGTSPRFEVKSLKLCADDIYDEEHDKIRYDLTNQELKTAPYSFVNEYKSIRLRSGSQDMEYGNIRSAVVSRLAQLSGSDHCTATKRCVVYLNGEYYGLFDMQQNYSDSYLANRFGLETSECIEKIKGLESEVFSEGGVSEYFNRDLNDTNNRRILEQYVDMDNYLFYCAIHILCNNTDWPENNFEMWRYTGQYDAGNKYSDGRFRFLIYDTDLVFSTDLFPEFFMGSTGDIFVSLMERINYVSKSSFSNVMKSAYYRDKLVVYIQDLLNTSFSEESIMKVVREEDEKIAKLRELYYDDEFVENAELYVEEIMKAAKSRPYEMEGNFGRYFGLYEKYAFSLQTSEGVAVMWNQTSIFEEKHYENQYYRSCDMVLRQEAYPGYAFQYWQVNGKRVYTSVLAVTDEMVLGGKVDIRAVASRDGTVQIVISELSAEGSSDWIRISNAGCEPADLRRYYISDDGDNLMKYQLPDIVLEAGESIVVYGSKNYQAVGDYICNFSLNENEILFLSNEKEILFQLPVPKMSAIETYGRYEGSNVWRFFRKESGF